MRRPSPRGELDLRRFTARLREKFYRIRERVQMIYSQSGPSTHRPTRVRRRAELRQAGGEGLARERGGAELDPRVTRGGGCRERPRVELDDESL